MKLLIYSDLHFEFRHEWQLPPDADGDVLILAGDIITFKDFAPLAHLLDHWTKPVLYIAGNHEYYTKSPMDQDAANFKAWLSGNLPQVTFLQDEAISFDGVHFFGGTMWTDFRNENQSAMNIAWRGMNDFRLIWTDENEMLEPSDSVVFHKRFVENLIAWFEEPLSGPRVVISHHAPIINPQTKYGGSDLQPAFVSLDMAGVIKKYQPDLWIYGHTHECDNQMLGKTRIISNQLGYPQDSGFECEGFDDHGIGVLIETSE